MAEASIPVDLFNPGQVFASLGFAEAADLLLGSVEACFDWSNRAEPRFWLRASGDESPIARVLRFLSEAKVIAETPHGSANLNAWNGSWGPRPDELFKGAPYSSPDPESPATLVAVLRSAEHEIRIDHWADATVRDNVKFWAGAGGYPGAALTRDALRLAKEAKCTDAADDPFALSVPQSSSFRLDWRRDYVPIDAGFSLNAHDDIETVGYPLVELLGAIGLTHARPRRLQTKLKYHYGVIGTSREVVWLPLTFVRAALGAIETPFETRRFHMFLGWPGKEGQARAITHVTEDSES